MVRCLHVLNDERLHDLAALSTVGASAHHAVVCVERNTNTENKAADNAKRESPIRDRAKMA